MKFWSGYDLPNRPVTTIQRALKRHAYQFLIAMAVFLSWSLWCLDGGDYRGAKNGIFGAAFWTLFSLFWIYAEVNQLLAALVFKEDVEARLAENLQSETSRRGPHHDPSPLPLQSHPQGPQGKA